MLKLTKARGATVFINPKLVTTVEDDLMSDGALVCFGNSETCITVNESPEDVASEISVSIGTYSIVDVAQQAADRAARVAETAAARAACAGHQCPGCPGCEVPF